MSGQIYEAIPAILRELDAIGKDRKNQSQGWMFRGVDDVYNALHPLLAEHKVFPTCEFSEMEREARETAKGGILYWVKLKAKYTLHASDGSSVSTEAIGEAMDSGDKACNKAMSVAYKYAMFQLLCIPTEAVDPDQQAHEPTRPAAKTNGTVRQVAAEHNMETGAELAERQRVEDTQIDSILAQIETHKGYREALQNLYDGEIMRVYKGGSGRLKGLIKEKVKPVFEAAMPKEPEPQPA